MSSPASVLIGSQSEPAPLPALHLVQARVTGYVHSEALTELAETVYFGLRRLNLRVFYREPPDRPVRLIVFGAHLLNEQQLEALPRDAIVYNSEQVEPESQWIRGAYLRALTQRVVWDYSDENVRRLRQLGAQLVRHVPLGYVPELVRIAPLPEDIDVLFYGSVNRRRQKILEALRERGLNVVTLFGCYGEERDRAIARAKVVLNVHFYTAKIFEIVRVAYLLSNSKTVVAECGPDTHLDPHLRDAMRCVPYEGLVAACVELAGNPGKRAELAERGRRIFAQRSEESILAAALGLTSPQSTPAEESIAERAQTPPAILHLGCGGDLRADCLNLDIDPACRPDAVCDLSSPNLIGGSLVTTRFGRVTLREEMFDSAIAGGIFEGIRDLPTATRNTLRLLRAGGVLEIVVPCDLSHGASQNPRRLRAFNERSWIYYADWHRRFGWLEARFDVVLIELRMSPLGLQLQAAGRTAEEILRTPRAVAGLRLRLRKRYLQESERREALRRQTPAGPP